MSEEEIRIEIAKLCGWTFKESMVRGMFGLGPPNVWHNPKGNCDDLPNYTQSLDACATFEKDLRNDIAARNKYSKILKDDVDHGSTDFFFCCATPMERCEAFLRLHGKWVTS